MLLCWALLVSAKCLWDRYFISPDLFSIKTQTRAQSSVKFMNSFLVKFLEGQIAKCLKFSQPGGRIVGGEDPKF